MVGAQATPVPGTTAGATERRGLGCREVWLVEAETIGAMAVLAAAQENAVQRRVVVVVGAA